MDWNSFDEKEVEVDYHPEDTPIDWYSFDKKDDSCSECGLIITDSQWAGSTDHGQTCSLHPSNIMEQPDRDECTCGHPECGAC